MIKCRWGILSTAEIGQKNWQAIWRTENGVVSAVASRDLGKAQTFIDLCQKNYAFEDPPTPVASYDDLINSDSVDAIYIPLPTGLRKEWVIKAANAGKHVICEKPCAVNAADLSEMIDHCKRNRVQFMDGVMYMHSARLAAVRNELDQGRIGKIKRINCLFSFNAPDEFRDGNIRTNSNLEPHGCLGDLGWYTIRFALWAMKGELPQRVTGRILSDIHREPSPEAVPMEFSGELFFANNVSAGFYVSFETGMQQSATICGTDGQITVPDFVLPYFGNNLFYRVSKAEFVVDGCEFVMEQHDTEHGVHEYGNGSTCAQETNMFRTMNEIVLLDQLDDWYPEMSLKTQTILDACFESAKAESEPVSLAQPATA